MFTFLVVLCVIGLAFWRLASLAKQLPAETAMGAGHWFMKWLMKK